VASRGIGGVLQHHFQDLGFPDPDLLSDLLQTLVGVGPTGVEFAEASDDQGARSVGAVIPNMGCEVRAMGLPTEMPVRFRL
jgi:hypothetical protein